MVEPSSRPVRDAENAAGRVPAGRGPAATLVPEPGGGPNSKWTFVAAPPGFAVALRVAPDDVTSVAGSVVTSVGAKASANSFCDPDAPAVKRKKGVPAAPAWQADPSPFVGFAVQVDEIGARSALATSVKADLATPPGVSSRKTGLAAPPSK